MSILPEGTALSPCRSGARLAAMISFLAAGYAQQPRDNAAPSGAAPDVRSGTARLSGVVQVDDSSAAPIRGAIVTLGGEGLAAGRTLITDDEGRFEFTSLPAGRFALTAKKAPFVTTAYGARRPGRPGTAITLSAGQVVAGIAVRMPQGAVITGQVTDALTGRPMADIPMAASRTDVVETSGVPSLQSSAATTDERGVYRLFGLVPGSTSSWRRRNSRCWELSLVEPRPKWTRCSWLCNRGRGPPARRRRSHRRLRRLRRRTGSRRSIFRARLPAPTRRAFACQRARSAVMWTCR